MRYWWTFSDDLVGGRSDAPRLPAAQVATLYRQHPAALQSGHRDRAWAALVDDRRQRRRRRSVPQVWGRRFGVAVDVLVSALVVQLLVMVTGPGAVFWPMLIGASVGLVAGTLACRAFVELAHTSQDMYGEVRR